MAGEFGLLRLDFIELFLIQRLPVELSIAEAGFCNL